MIKRFYKNEYAVLKKVKDFTKYNPLGRMIRPLLRAVYHRISAYLPYPRDFLLRQIPPRAICCEIGVYEGVFSKMIERSCNPAKLYLVDPWQAIPNHTEEKYQQQAQDARHNAVVNAFSHQIAEGKVIIVRKTSDAAAADFFDRYFDFVYIDGDHSYEQVVKDLEHYFPKVKQGGLLCGDDYQILDVRRAVGEFVTKYHLSLKTKNHQFIITV